MKKTVFALLITGLLCHGAAAIAAVEYKIVTAWSAGRTSGSGVISRRSLLPRPT